jgi:hypothetical protein
MIHLLIIAAIVYFAFHLGHSHAKYRHYRRYPWYKRIWVSLPGPFNTRIGKRI